MGYYGYGFVKYCYMVTRTQIKETHCHHKQTLIVAKTLAIPIKLNN